ncbi:unnamed protein product [Rotaria sp. Silwood1]|nr:unnamed protein product [Rotaria sp. Silwood1]CAF3859132.1 unnamed protein product [Rotaria sp. Silwood1]
MRTYYSYRLVTEALCGFLLDHNDAIDKNILEKVYKRTADRWFEAYNTEYGKNINKNQLNTSQYASNCALVSRKKLVISSSSSETKVVKSNDSSKTAYLNDGHEGGGGSGDTCGDNGADGDGGGAGCAGCGDDGGGGDGGGAGCGGCGGGGC